MKKNKTISFFVILAIIMISISLLLTFLRNKKVNKVKVYSKPIELKLKDKKIEYIPTIDNEHIIGIKYQDGILKFYNISGKELFNIKIKKDDMNGLKVVYYDTDTLIIIKNNKYYVINKNGIKEFDYILKITKHYIFYIKNRQLYRINRDFTNDIRINNEYNMIDNKKIMFKLPYVLGDKLYDYNDKVMLKGNNHYYIEGDRYIEIREYNDKNVIKVYDMKKNKIYNNIPITAIYKNQKLYLNKDICVIHNSYIQKCPSELMAKLPNINKKYEYVFRYLPKDSKFALVLDVNKPSDYYVYDINNNKTVTKVPLGRLSFYIDNNKFTTVLSNIKTLKIYVFDNKTGKFKEIIEESKTYKTLKSYDITYKDYNYILTKDGVEIKKSVYPILFVTNEDMNCFNKIDVIGMVINIETNEILDGPLNIYRYENKCMFYNIKDKQLIYKKDNKISSPKEVILFNEKYYINMDEDKYKLYNIDTGESKELEFLNYNTIIGDLVFAKKSNNKTVALNLHTNKSYELSGELISAVKVDKNIYVSTKGHFYKIKEQ